MILKAHIRWPLFFRSKNWERNKRTATYLFTRSETTFPRSGMNILSRFFPVGVCRIHTWPYSSRGRRFSVIVQAYKLNQSSLFASGPRLSLNFWGNRGEEIGWPNTFFAWHKSTNLNLRRDITCVRNSQITSNFSANKDKEGDDHVSWKKCDMLV